MKKISLIIILVLIAFIVFSNDYVAKKALTAPVIDGIDSESCWADAIWYNIDQVWLGPAVSGADFTGKFKVCWDEDYLYLLGQITDDLLSDVHSDPLDSYWDDDTFEIFLDEDKSGGDHTYNYNAFAYHMAIDCLNKVDLHTDESPRLYNDHVNVAKQTSGNVTIWEASFLIYDDTFVYGGPNTPQKLYANKVMGMAVAYCDNDGDTYRDNFFGSEYIEGSDKNLAWKTADVFGSVTLIDSTPQVINLSLNGTAFSSSVYSSYATANANDGLETTLWAANLTDKTPYLYINLGKICKIEKIVVKWYDPYYASSYYIGAYVGGDWVKAIVTGDGNIDEHIVSSFNINAQLIGIQALAGPTGYYGIKEFEIWGY